MKRSHEVRAFSKAFRAGRTRILRSYLLNAIRTYTLAGFNAVEIGKIVGCSSQNIRNIKSKDNLGIIDTRG